jgi:hypothetical protein
MDCNILFLADCKKNIFATNKMKLQLRSWLMPIRSISQTSDTTTK